MVELDEAVGARVGDAGEIDGRARAAGLVEAMHDGEIGVGEDIAVQHEHRAPREVGGVAHAAAGAERLALDDVAQAHAEVRAVTERLLHVVDAIGAGQDHVGDAVGLQQRELVGEERPPQQWHHRLGAGQREGAQPRAPAAGEDDRLGGGYAPDQGSASLMSITGMPSRIG